VLCHERADLGLAELENGYQGSGCGLGVATGVLSDVLAWPGSAAEGEWVRGGGVVEESSFTMGER